MPSREDIRKEHDRILRELAPFYENDESALLKEADAVRRGDPGAVGDMSVICWGAAQLQLLKMLPEQVEPKPKRARRGK